MKIKNDNNITYTGGCEIGPRPIDLHIKALRSMGAIIDEASFGLIKCKAPKLKGCEINLDYPSVGATENIMLTAVFADGITYIRNAAKEPEIVDLQRFLNEAGVEVTGAGTGVIKIAGTTKGLSDVEHVVMPDRIEAGTYLVAIAATGGEGILSGVIPDHFISVIHNLKDSGCRIKLDRSCVWIKGTQTIRPIDKIRTLPYPGFPTDMQSQMCAYLTLGKGTSVIVETVFESRFKYIDELNKLGADVNVEGRTAIIRGVKKLKGANISAKELRGGAALIIAGLTAENTTTISGVNFIDRGYECPEDKLTKLGANIIRIKELKN